MLFKKTADENKSIKNVEHAKRGSKYPWPNNEGLV